MGRRLLLAAIAIAASTMLFRAQIASALVSRGDEFLYRGQLTSARFYYARALWVDQSSAVAADRFAFFGMEQRTPKALAESIQATSRFLQLDGANVNVLLDRALCYQVLHQYDKATADFMRAAQVSRDPRYFTFAGWAALRSGRRAKARALWVAALRSNPLFLPARRALEENR